jgi:hypothetical protein
LVEARPETIAEDYRRVLDLAGLGAALNEGPLQILLANAAQGFAPGRGATPWQLEETLTWLGDKASQATVGTLGERGLSATLDDSWWRDCLARHRTEMMAEDALRLHRPVSPLLHPALDAVLPHGVQVPVGLASGSTLLLTAPTLRAPWGVSCAVAPLRSLVAPGVSAKRRAPAAEIAAEAMGVARELIPRLGVVVDGTLWAVETGKQGPAIVARNVLLAGTDPVAVDAVVMRLAGLDPLRVPWLRICVDRGFGQALPQKMRIVGRTDLLELDFALGDPDLGLRDRSLRDRSGRAAALVGALGRWLDRARYRSSELDWTDTPWSRLHAELRAESRIARPPR